MVRVGSPEAGEAPCHLIPTKIGHVADPFRCMVCGGENVRGSAKQSLPLSPLVRRFFELAFPSHSDGPIHPNRASARDADAHIGVIEFGGSQVSRNGRQSASRVWQQEAGLYRLSISLLQVVLYVTNSNFRGAWSPRDRECTPRLTSTASPPFLPPLCPRLTHSPEFPPWTGLTLPRVSCDPAGLGQW